MKKTSKSSSLIKLLGNFFKPQKPASNNNGVRPNHQPSWMYRNE